jgi:CspA family cold shock protein
MATTNEQDVRGTVKWFNSVKGFGFIVRSHPRAEDVFVHYTDIAGDGFRVLDEGEEVVFDVLYGAKGAHAHNVRRPTAPAAPEQRHP